MSVKLFSFGSWRSTRNVVAIAAFGLLSACDDFAPMPSAPSGAKMKEVKVAILTPQSDEDSTGVANSLQMAATMAAEDVKGLSITLSPYDTGAQPEQAAAQARAAVNEGADIILGPLFGESANAAALAIAGSNVNVLSFSNNQTIAGNNLFILGSTFTDKAVRLMEHARANGIARPVLVYPDTLEGEFGRAAVQNAAMMLNTPLAGTVNFEFTQTGIVEAIPLIKDMVTQTGADGIILTARSTGALPLLSQMMYDQGITSQQVKFLGLSRWDIPAQTLTSSALQGGWFVLPDQSRAQTFQSRYAARFGEASHPIAGLAYDGIAAIAALANQGGPAPLSKARLSQSAGFVGVEGIFRFTPQGTNERGYSIGQVDNGRVIIVSPAPTQF
ncbi:MAG: penicillin-binding protein activator [Paracoccaceae bacterium]